MEKSLLLETIGDTVENRILDFLIEGRNIDYSKKDIADGCEISRPTVYKILPKLVKDGSVKVTRKIGRITLYSINPANERARILIKIEEMLLNGSFEDIEKPAAHKMNPAKS
jgi:Fe2+ or Zn2+ uptake regulation protein